MSEIKVTKDAATKTLTVERVFDAPRAKVWQAWTDPEIFAKWWGPHGWETTVKQLDFKIGGYLLYGMKCVDKNQGDFFGQESWGKSTYTAIDEPDSFVYEDAFSDSDGNLTPGMPVTTVTTEFHEEDGKTRLVSISVFETEAGFNQVIEMGVVEGLTQTWDRLEELVSAQ